MYQDLANVLFWGDHKSIFIKWYQLPNVVDQRLPPHMSWITNPTPGMLRRTNPPLVCYGERIHPWYAKDHESTPGMPRITKLLFCGETVGFGKNQPGTKIIEKSLDHEKPGEWESQKNTFKNPRKIKFFLAATFSRISVIQTFFRWNWKNKNEHQEYSMETGCMLRRTMLCYGERFHPWYAPEHESTPGMPRITNPPLVCYGSRIHPWYAKDHECQQSQNSPTHVGYG